MSKRQRRKSQLTKKVAQPTTLVDIVIAVFNRFDLFEECLDAIEAAADGVSYQIIVVDNGSTEEPEGFYDGRNIDVVRNENNLGFPKACNIGAGRKRSPLIFFLNTDVILDPGSLKILVQELDDPQVGVAGMKLVFPDDLRDLSPQIRSAGKLQHIGLSINIHTKPIHHFIGWSEDNPKVNRLKEVTAVTGAALLVRRSLWAKVGGFDEAYGHGTYEDLSLCIEIQKLGYNIHVVPKARGIHYTGATAEKYGVGYSMQMNHLTFLNKYLQGLSWSEWLIW